VRRRRRGPAAASGALAFRIWLSAGDARSRGDLAFERLIETSLSGPRGPLAADEDTAILLYTSGHDRPQQGRGAVVPRGRREHRVGDEALAFLARGHDGARPSSLPCP
jgi:hypothetical protein